MSAIREIAFSDCYLSVVPCHIELFISGVMAGACPGHPRLLSLKARKKDVDARDKRGHDAAMPFRFHPNAR
jgi:hypothetical protein